MEGPSSGKGRGRDGDEECCVGRIPNDCIARILSLTSPGDACRSSAVCTAFLSAAGSEAVWERFLPPDYREILARSPIPVGISSNRELYFRLCDSILVDGGGKRVWLERPTGKKCYMLSARSIRIIWGNDHRYWRWISVPDARFPEVAELVAVCRLQMKASIRSGELSPGTRYGAYLVMRLTDSPLRMDHPPQQTEIYVGGVLSSTRRVRLQEEHRSPNYRSQYPWQFLPNVDPGAAEADEDEEEDVPLPDDEGWQPSEWRDEQVCVPRARRDGWMELEMGGFFVELGGEELVEVRLRGYESIFWKRGLIVHGIELRPVPFNN